MAIGAPVPQVQVVSPHDSAGLPRIDGFQNATNAISGDIGHETVRTRPVSGEPFRRIRSLPRSVCFRCQQVGHRAAECQLPVGLDGPRRATGGKPMPCIRGRG